MINSIKTIDIKSAYNLEKMCQPQSLTISFSGSKDEYLSSVTKNKKHKIRNLTLSTALAAILGLPVYSCKNYLLSGKMAENQKNITTLLMTNMQSDNENINKLSSYICYREGVRPFIYNDRMNKINFNIVQLLGLAKGGKYTVGIGHMITNQKGDLIKNLKKDLKEAQDITGYTTVSTDLESGKLSNEQIVMLLHSDMLKTQKQCMALLNNDIAGYPNSLIKWDNIDLNKQTAILSLTFNVGAGKIKYNKDKKQTNLLTYLREGNFAKAQSEFDYFSQNGTPYINIIKTRYIEMLLINNAQLTEESEQKLITALKKCKDAGNIKTIEALHESVKKELTLLGLY